MTNDVCSCEQSAMADLHRLSIQVGCPPAEGSVWGEPDWIGGSVHAWIRWIVHTGRCALAQDLFRRRACSIPHSQKDVHGSRACSVRRRFATHVLLDPRRAPPRKSTRICKRALQRMRSASFLERKMEGIRDVCYLVVGKQPAVTLPNTLCIIACTMRHLHGIRNIPISTIPMSCPGAILVTNDACLCEQSAMADLHCGSIRVRCSPAERAIWREPDWVGGSVHARIRWVVHARGCTLTQDLFRRRACSSSNRQKDVYGRRASKASKRQ